MSHIRSRPWRLLTNFVLFQAGWLVCVIGTNHLAVLVAVALVVLHLLLVSHRPALELGYIALGTVAGSLLDGLWWQLGILQPATGALDAAWIPLWLVLLWSLFLTTINHSLAWVADHRWLPWLLAPIAGPLAYWSASQLDAVRLQPMSLAFIALGWLLVFPLLIQLRNRWFGALAAGETS
ncbi:MAG: DUF2878 domain-containing protein [Pseudomonadales bacterium]|nr:DUF2878 domain-containing protein [Pseudomonadales bacterium]